MENSYFYPARVSSDKISQFESKEPQGTWKELCPALGKKKKWPGKQKINSFFKKNTWKITADKSQQQPTKKPPLSSGC